MGASTSTRPRRASSDVTQGRRRTQLRSASGTFFKTDSHLLTPWYPTSTTPVTSRNGSPRSSRSSFNKIPENDYVIDNANPEEGRQQRSNSRSFLGRLIRRTRAGTLGSTSTIEGIDTNMYVEGIQETPTANVLGNGSKQNTRNADLEMVLLTERDNSNHDDKNSYVDNVFFDVAHRPRLASVDSSCSDGEAPATQDNQLVKKQRSETLVYRAAVEEKAVQTDQVDYPESRVGSMTCDHCRRHCLCYKTDPYDSNSSTQSLKIYTDEKNKRRRKRWSPLIKRRQVILKQTVYANPSASNTTHYDKGYQSTPVALRPCPHGLHSHIPDYPSQSQSSSPKRWNIQYRQNRRRRRTFSEDRVDETDSPLSSQCGNTNSDPSLCSQKSSHTAESHTGESQTPYADHITRARLYTLCLHKAKIPLVKSSSCSPTVPQRRQTWSEKSRPQRSQCEGQKKTKGFLYLLRNLRGSRSETDVSMEHRRSVDSNGYVDPFYITRNFSRLNLKRLSLSHPSINTGFKGSTSPPSGLKGKVSAAVGRLERALTGRASFGRTYSMDSQQSTSTGWNSDLPGSPTDSDAAAYTYNKHQHGPVAENGYMTFDPELNPPMPRPRRILCSSGSSAPSSPGFHDGLNAAFDDVTNNACCEEEGIYESLDNYSPRRRWGALTSLPSSDGDTPPEVPPRPPSHRLRYRARMLRRQMPLPPIPIAHSTLGNAEDGSVAITTASSAGSINTAKHSLYRTTCRRHNFIFGQSSSCSKLPSFQMDSSEEDSVFEAHMEHTPISKTQTEQTIGDTGMCIEKCEQKC